MRHPSPFLLLFAFICSSASAQFISASNKSHTISRKEFFSNEQPLEMTLVSDFKKLKSDRKAGALQKAMATLTLSGTDSVTDEIQINARGQYRRQICQMPSLMVNFKNTASILSKLKKMKLVCGCASTANDEELLLKEYLAYKIYNLVADMSFKVRLVKVNYKDVANKMKAYSQYGFFIEDVDDMAKRNACAEYQNKATSQTINRSQMTTVALFEYMIGNTDWSVSNFHNIKLMRPVADSLISPYAVPYDFDFAGIVNAPYAFPNDAFPIEKVTDRLYRGYPRTLDEIQKALQPFLQKKVAIYSLVLNFDLLHKRERETMINYLDDFYAIIEKEKKVKETFIDGAWKD